jgi:hypothetical protein
MEKEFISYELALELKQLGFDEPCLAVFNDSKQFRINSESRNWNDNLVNGDTTSSPTYSQAFRWFREKFGMCIVIKPIDDKNLELGYNLLKNGLMMGSHPTYEEAELACLQKLIEILQNLIVIVKSR